MIELEGPALRAASPGVAHECAAPPVAAPDRTFHMRWHVSRILARLRRCLPWSNGGSAFGSLKFPEQGVEGPVQNLLEITGMNTRTQEFLDCLELVVGPLPDCGLERESLRRERDDARRSGNRPRWFR